MKMQPRAESGQDTHPGGRALAAVRRERSQSRRLVPPRLLLANACMKSEGFKVQAGQKAAPAPL